MKRLDILNIVFLIPIIIIIVDIIGSLSFGCSFSESDMLAHCKVGIMEPIMTFLSGLTLLLAFSGFIWIIPAISISVRSFKEDYYEVKTNNLPFRLLFKKISLYAVIPYLLLGVSIVGLLIFLAIWLLFQQL